MVSRSILMVVLVFATLIIEVMRLHPTSGALKMSLQSMSDTRDLKPRLKMSEI
jgi:hypothetical protein